MGLFDSVVVKCPNCDGQVDFQSKAAESPYLNVYSCDDGPPVILFDVMNRPEYCQKCGTWMALIDRRYPPGAALPKPDLQAVKVKTPLNPKIHPQGLRWWPEDSPFTFADIEDESSDPAS